MKSYIYITLLVLVFTLFFTFESVSAQSSSDIKKSKAEYEKTHPKEKTYFIEQVFILLEPADEIMPNARAVTNEKWEKIGGAMFGILRSFSKNKFADKYFEENGKFKKILAENLLTDPSSFQTFIEKHKENSFRKVTLWKAGYLMFYTLEDKEKTKDIYMIVVPVKPKLFEEL